ncbi:MAG TPA: glutathione S-transferase family protein [Polyangiaceae bacterium]|nr:glutathione S-transferase family protein [Polyangiaceae bacterium]
MKLYNADLSPNCLRVRAVAFELGIELEIVEVSLSSAGSNVALQAVNPNSKVPVLVDEDFVLWESRAINNYLCSKRPDRNLLPMEPRARALVEQWLYWQAIHLGPAMQTVAYERVIKPKFGLGEPDAAVIDAKLKETHKLLPVFDQALGKRPWIADELSVADFALASTFMYRKPAELSLAEVPAVSAWIQRVEARDSWRKAVAPIVERMGL